MSAADYERQKYIAGMESVRRAMTQLREHFESVTINVSYADAAGVEIALEHEWSEDDDDEDDDKTST
jgi:hypothetical protein